MIKLGGEELFYLIKEVKYVRITITQLAPAGGKEYDLKRINS